MIQQIKIADTIINIVPTPFSSFKLIKHNKYGFEVSPLFEKEDNYISVVGKNPITIEIKCFVTTPPPQRYRGCPECGNIKTLSGSLILLPSLIKDYNKNDLLHIIIRDGDNEVAEVTARVRGFLKS